jgi:hypothetical protein
VTYAYELKTTGKGRFSKITGTNVGLPAYGAVYTYKTNTDLVETVSLMESETEYGVRATRSYEDHRDLVTVVNNETPEVSPVSQYEYRYDALGRRKDVVTTGDAFSPSRLSLWGYNSRSELTSSHRYNGTDPDSPCACRFLRRDVGGVAEMAGGSVWPSDGYQFGRDG